jgi:FKBP-type peptidyl-prolyl cis-trans isomerase
MAVYLLGAMTVFAAEEKSTKKPAVTSESKTDKPSAKPKAVQFKSEIDKVSYIIGTQIGKGLKGQDLGVNLDLLFLGIKDMFAGKEPALNEQEIQTTMMLFQQTMKEKEQKKAEKNIAEGKEFLEKNKKKEGFKVTASGLQYKVIKKGTGKTPQRTDKVKTHYRGTLMNGEEFDSSYKRNKPAEFAVGGVIKGWTEALLLMKEGAKWQLFIPSELAYGPRERPSIPANSVLIFEIEFLEIVEKPKVDMPKIEFNPGK